MLRNLRPSPALIVASLALVVAVSGTAYAAATINGRSIADHSIAGRKLINDTLTGTQIKESHLATVPRAANAEAVGGITVRKVFYAPKTNSTTPTTILHLGGLVLTATCANGDVEVVMTAQSTTPTCRRRCGTPRATAAPMDYTTRTSAPTAHPTSSP